jgi:hypothetical protein
MSRALVAALAKLLEGVDQSPDRTCSASAFTNAQRHALEDLGRKTGALRLRPQGRGSVYQVIELELLRSHMRSLRPQHESDVDVAIPPRAANIARSRNSKGHAHGHELHYLLVKAITDDAIWVAKSDEQRRVFDLGQTTKAAGAGALAIREDDGWYSDQPLWLVENQALFDRLDWLPPNSRGTVAYYAGQLPARLLSWLGHSVRAPKIIIFPDYDGVGLLNYAKLLDCSRSPCTLWLMPNWQELLITYGSNLVWQNTRGDFEAALTRIKDLSVPDDVLLLFAALRRHGLALEHEAVWLSPPFI